MSNLTIATWNVLARAHIHRGRYSSAALNVLHRDNRIEHLVQFIKELDVDITGLQEVEQGLLDALIATGYWQVFWSPRRQGRPDNCALLVRRDIFVKESNGVQFSDDSGHAWHYAVIGDVAIVNTHIKWAPEHEKDHAGLKQTQELLDRLSGRRVVLLGDCNGRPGGLVRTALDSAGFVNVWGDTPTALIVHEDSTERAPIDLIALRDVKGEPLGALQDVDDIPSHRCPSDHVPVTATIHI